ncbi:hypothetical protein L211DRAFT_480774 [Terfezia boudieri ATCC MYA-4762]|uniref:C2H2 type master regulator of conidiophore development brlA n=1 Tax=Terfezia boudieri ATCC MYA-4762 TaxID=1051890 RepID=A0A3N4LYQ7_9PEZI|nr:hypothetical protein L211DRAFT_480774 [Terfezia boudieri ATCC MYA-4762]
MREFIQERSHTRAKLAQSNSSALARHRGVHSEIRPYKCSYPNCQKAFKRKSTLTGHQNGHTLAAATPLASIPVHLVPSTLPSYPAPSPHVGPTSQHVFDPYLPTDSYYPPPCTCNYCVIHTTYIW